jgi:hypothetical protein
VAARAVDLELEVRNTGDKEITSLVGGTNPENRLSATGAAQAEAWSRACEQAREVGLLAPPRG